MPISKRQHKSSHTLMRSLLAAVTLTVVPSTLLYAQSDDKPTYSPEVLAILEENRKANQNAEVKKDAPRPAELIDAELFLNHPLVLSEKIDSVIWTVLPREGRQLISVPIDFSDIKEDVEIRDPLLKLKTGRFLCWLIEEKQAENNNQNRRNRGYQQGPNYGPDMGMMDPMGMGMDTVDIEMMGPMGGAPRQQQRPQVQQKQMTYEELEALKPEIPHDAPRIARTIKLNADGSVTWELERNISGAEVSNTNSLYSLRIDSRMMNERRPLRPGETRRPSSSSRSRTSATRSRSTSSRSNGGIDEMGGMGMPTQSRSRTSSRSSSTRSRSSASSRNTDRQKQREEQLKYRAAQEQYKELQKQVRELPDTFTLKKPAQIWAVYDLPLAVSKITSNTEPEWTLTFDDLEILQSTSSINNSSTRGQLNPQAYQVATDLQKMASNDNPFITKLVANALYNSGSLPTVQDNDPIYRLANQLISSNDPLVRIPIVKGLSEAIPPTTTTLELLKGASGAMGTDEQLLILKPLLAIDTQDPMAANQMLKAINHIISNPAGPDINLVIDKILSAVSDEQQNRSSSRNRNNTTTTTDLTKLLTHGLSFDTLKGERLDNAILTIATSAGKSRLAAGWMNHQLLGSPDQSIPKRTLKLVNSIEAPKSEMIDKAASKILTAFLGNKNNTSNDVTEKLESDIAEAEAALTTQIPILTTSHNIFRALNSGDKETRKLAWNALKHFNIGTPVIKSDSRYRQNNFNNQGDMPVASVYDRIVESAVRQADTPDGLAYFFAKQQHEDYASRALVRLIIEGDDAAALESGIKLRKSNRSLDIILQELSIDDREAFAKRIYTALDNKAPLVAGLLRDPDQQAALAIWFGQEIAHNDLPSPSKFADIYPNDNALLALAGSSDQSLATGAIAALVASAGGNEKMQQKMAQSIASRPDRSISALETFWSNTKREIHTRALKKAAGTYTLFLLVRGDDGTAQSNNARNNRNMRNNRNTAPQIDPMSMEMQMEMGMMEMDTAGMGAGGPRQPYPGTYKQQQPRKQAPQLSDLPILREITVGTVELIVEAGTAHFEGDLILIEVPSDFLGLSILNLTDLKNFGVPELDTIDFDQTETEGMDIRIEKDGSWRGQTKQLNDVYLEVVLKPTGE
ncbi:hypothetical protein JD969_11735 [Planctomycetota bacterium]|nr:hypothetical protein JD969_11735 [Planctomycetota bacterium]